MEASIDINVLADLIANKLRRKDIMTIKELSALGYPVKMLREIASNPRSQSVIKRGGQGSITYFEYAKLSDDIALWKRYNN